jgi:hypothetical protein
MASSVLLFSALAVSSLAGCEIVSEQVPTEEDFTSLSVDNKTALEVKWIIGDERTVDLSGIDNLGGALDISALVKAGKIKITIDDATIISVNGLKLTALKAGTTKVTVKGGGISIEINIVVEAPALTALALTSSATSGIIGDVITFSVTQTPSNALIAGLTYKIEKNSTGEGTLKDNKLTITKKGSIIVSANVGTVVSNKVTITASLPNLKSIKLTSSSNGGVIGDVITLTATPTPDIASIEGLKYTIESSSTGNGTIKGNKLTLTEKGTIVISASVGKIVSDKVTIVASLPNLKSLKLSSDKTSLIIGERAKLTAVPTPEIASIEGLKYEIVDGGTGSGTIDKDILTATKPGTIKVVAKVKNITSNEITITASLPALTEIAIDADKKNVVIDDVVTFTSVATPENASLTGITYSIKEESTGDGIIKDNKLTVTGVGDILVSAKVGSIESNVITIKVALPDLTSITLSSDVSSDPRVGDVVTFNSVAIPAIASLDGITYSVVEGSTGEGTFDEINKNKLTITKAGTIKVQANVDDIKSNIIEFTAKKPSVTAIELTLVGEETTGVIGTKFNFLSKLTPENGDTEGYEIKILEKSTGTATIEGNLVTVTGAGDIYVVAQLGDVVSNEVKIIGTLPALTALKIAADKASAVLHEEVTFTPTATPELADISGIIYSIKEGSTGTGTIEGNVLTITGVGTINVIGTVGTIVSEAVSITAVLPSVTTITIEATKTEIEDTETVTFSETFTPTDGDTAGFEYVIDAANSTGTGTITDKVLTVTKAGTIKVYGHIGELKSNVITITATHIEKCTTSVSTDVVNGTVTISPIAGSDIPTGEVTITATPDQSYLLTKVWVKIDGGEETEITATGTTYTYTTEDKHSYVFGATFTEIEISTIAAAKTATNGTMVRVVGVCTFVKDYKTAYIQVGGSGIMIYYENHGMEVSGHYDIYGEKNDYNGTAQITKVASSYIKESVESPDYNYDTIDSKASCDEYLTSANAGNGVYVNAKITNLDDSVETKGGTTGLDIDGVSVNLYRAKNISKEQYEGLKVGDFVKIKCVIGTDYDSKPQLLLMPTTSITKTNIAPTAITCVSDKETLALGATADLNETATLSTTSTGAWNSTFNKDAVTYEITDAGTTGATITGSTLSATSTGTIKVVSKYGELTSAEISITVTDPLLSTLVISGASDATSINKGETLQLSVKDGRGNAVDGITWAVSTESSTIASINNAGLVSGLLAGSATITATKEGYTTAEFTLSVTDASLLDMVSDPISVALTVGDADKELAISRDGAAVTGYMLTSSNESVCTIVDNKIHAVAAGETDVTVSKDGYNSIILHVVVSAAVVESSVITFISNDSGDSSTPLTPANIENNLTISDNMTKDDFSFLTVTKVYQGKQEHGFKLGSSNATFNITFEFATKKFSKIVINAANYNNSNASIIVNDSASQSLSSTFEDYTFELLEPTGKFEIKNGTGAKRCYIKSITLI